MDIGLYVALWLLANLVFVACYDGYCFFFMHEDSSVSFWLQLWMSRFPALAIAIGFLIGHLTWPVITRKE